jgi:hypothetical protein
LASEPFNENIFYFQQKNNVVQAKDSILSAVCEESNNYETVRLKKVRIDSLADIKSISISTPVSVVALSEMAIIEWNGANSDLVEDYRLQIFPDKKAYFEAASRLDTRRVITGLSPGTVYSLSITPIVNNRNGKTKVIVFTTEPKRITNLDVVLCPECSTEVYSPLLNVNWEDPIIDDSKVN